MTKGRFILWGEEISPTLPGFRIARKHNSIAIAVSDKELGRNIISRDESSWLVCPVMKSNGAVPTMVDFDNPVARFPR